jgi:citrate lyase subunit beta-like protein
MIRARRALLYIPGDDLHKIKKATTLSVDSICMDIEDGVALKRKASARNTIIEALNNLDFGGSEKLVRINAIGWGLWLDDLEAVVPEHPDGIVIPKVQSSDQIHQACVAISQIEKQYGIPDGKTPIIVIVESARGIVQLKEIITADPRLTAVIFGADDYAVDIGASRTKEGREVFYARSAVVTYASAYGLQAIDMVYIEFKDQEGLFREAIEGSQMGFSGKQIIHPSQVEPVQRAFTPGDEAIGYALEILQAFENNQQSGIGAFALDGKMIDAPTVKIAERVVALARAAGKIH